MVLRFCNSFFIILSLFKLNLVICKFIELCDVHWLFLTISLRTTSAWLTQYYLLAVQLNLYFLAFTKHV